MYTKNSKERKDCCDLVLEYVSGWCGHGFESHSQLVLLIYPGLIKAYDVLFLFDNCDMETLISH